MITMLKKLASCLLIGLFCVSTTLAADAEAPAVPWNGAFFKYEKPSKMVVEQKTPTDAQVNFWIRPPQLSADSPEPQSTGAADPREVGHADLIHLLFKDATGDLVPAMLCTPRGQKGPFPVVIAIHGLTSNKIQVIGQVAPTLIRKGYAILAADLPCHGERPGEPLNVVDRKDPAKVIGYTQKAVIDNRQLIDLAAQFPQLDVSHGVIIVGYSLGTWVCSLLGPSDDRVKAMVLMVGGLPDSAPDAPKSPEAEAVSPRNSLPHFAGRPMLLLNGKTDNIIKPAWSDRLFAICPEPKKQLWYESGHFLPSEAFEDAANWIEVHAVTNPNGTKEQKKAG